MQKLDRSHQGQFIQVIFHLIQSSVNILTDHLPVFYAYSCLVLEGKQWELWACDRIKCHYCVVRDVLTQDFIRSEYTAMNTNGPPS